MVHKVFHATKPTDWQSISCPMTTLDLFCDTHSAYPDLIKLDVEGAEYKVLKGAQKVIYKYRPLILLSVHPSQLIDLGSDVSRLSLLIEQLGYDIYDSNNCKLHIDTPLFFAEYLLRPRQHL